MPIDAFGGKVTARWFTIHYSLFVNQLAADWTIEIQVESKSGSVHQVIFGWAYSPAGAKRNQSRSKEAAREVCNNIAIARRLS